MRINIKTVFVSLLGIFLVAVFIIMTIYLVNRKINTGENVSLTPDPTKEFQKAENDKAVTKIYRGKLACQDCDAVEVSLALTKETEDESGGTYILIRAFLGTGRDAEDREGEWIMGENDKEVVLNPGNPDEVRYAVTDQRTLEMIGDSDVVLELFE